MGEWVCLAQRLAPEMRLFLRDAAVIVFTVGVLYALLGMLAF